MGWLHAVPEQPKDNKKPRCKLLSKDDYRLDMPIVEHCNDVLKGFSDSGMAMAGGMGAVPLTWQELKAMNEAGGYFLGYWECQQIIKMSVAYCSMLQKARDNIPAPYQRELSQDEKQQLGLAQLRAMERAEQENNQIIKNKKPSK